MRPWHSIPTALVGLLKEVQLSGCASVLRIIVLLLGVSVEGWASSAVRTLPPYFTGTNSFEVVLDIRTDPDVLIYAVEEHPPLGWRATDLNEGGVVDGTTLKWGPFVGAGSRVLRYRITAQVAAESGVFEGRVETGTGHFEIAGAPRLDRFVGVATRTLPATYTPGTPMTVGLVVVPAPETRVWAVEEVVPDGWIPSAVSAGGVWDAATGRIKWGVFSTALPRSLTYLITPPLTNRHSGEFTGQVQFGTASTKVVGSSVVELPPPRLARQVPETYVAGDSFPVQIQCQPASYNRAYAVEETPPSGVVVESIELGGVLDVQTGKIKWGPFNDRSVRTLGYRLRPGALQRGMLTFSGTGVFDTIPLPIAGPATVSRVGTFSKTDCLRSMAATYTLGEGLVVQLRLNIGEGVGNVAVEETIPEGWGIGGILQGGLFDSENRKVKWIVPLGIREITLSYTVQPSVEASGAGKFAGSVQADLEAVPIVGRDTVERVQPVVKRTLPQYYSPGVGIELRLETVPTQWTRVYSVEETLPQGWTVLSVDGGGVWDSEVGRLKWGPFADASPRQFKALLRPPSNLTGIARFDGLAVFDREYTHTQGSAWILESLEEVPASVHANPDAAEYVVNRPATIPVDVLLANDTNESIDTPWVVQVDAKSLRGADVRLEGASIVYTPSPGFGGLDLFKYRIRNGPGSTSESRVLMYPLSDGVIPVQALALIESLASGEVRLRFAAIPGLSYGIQGLDDVGTAGWKSLGTRTVGLDGYLEFVDPDAVGRAMRFYQAVPQ